MLSTAVQQRLRILRIFAIVLATAIACISVIYFSIPMQDTQQAQFDVILVLGNPAKDDGSIAPLAKSRVLEGIRQYRAGVAPRLLMTGGAVRNRFVEAQVMLQFAESQGVPASALLAEGQSQNTIQNAYYSYKIMQAHDWTSALVVTSPTHVRRASLIFQPLSSRLANGCGALAARITLSGSGSGSGPAKLDTPATDVSSAFPTHGNICPIRISRFPGSKENRPRLFWVVKTLNACPSSSGFQFNRPQQLAALLLLLLLAQCMWVFHRQTLTSRDYDFARCGREMWEKPNPLAGYFTTCGNIPDGTLGYRVAGLPLTLQRVLAGQNADTSTWEMRHELGYVLLLLHSGFLLTGILLGGALWWVTRRLYGNPGGFIALALYCFCPAVIHACTYPNNEILTAFGLFASLYTAMGVAHAMQGPPRKWRSRIVLLTLTLAFTAASHVAAFLLALLLSIVFMAYLAVGRRAYIVPIIMAAGIGTLLLLFASYDFSPDAFSYFFRSGAGRIWFSLQPARQWFLSLPNSAVTLAAAHRPAALSAHAQIAVFWQHRPTVSGPAVLLSHHPRNFQRAHALGTPFSAHLHRRGVCRFP